MNDLFKRGRRRRRGGGMAYPAADGGPWELYMQDQCECIALPVRWLVVGPIKPGAFPQVVSRHESKAAAVRAYKRIRLVGVKQWREEVAERKRKEALRRQAAKAEL